MFDLFKNSRTNEEENRLWDIFYDYHKELKDHRIELKNKELRKTIKIPNYYKDLYETAF